MGVVVMVVVVVVGAVIVVVVVVGAVMVVVVVVVVVVLAIVKVCWGKSGVLVEEGCVLSLREVATAVTVSFFGKGSLDLEEPFWLIVGATVEVGALTPSFIVWMASVTVVVTWARVCDGSADTTAALVASGAATVKLLLL